MNKINISVTHPLKSIYEISINSPPATLFISLGDRGKSNSLCPPPFTYSNKITYASF